MGGSVNPGLAAMGAPSLMPNGKPAPPPRGGVPPPHYTCNKVRVRIS